MFIVGSTAFNYWNPNPDFLSRNPDLDIWCSDKSKINKKMFNRKLDVSELPQNVLDLLEYQESFIIKNGHLNPINVITLDTLYTIKCSHLGWDNPKWDKHKADVLYLKETGCEIIQPLYRALIEHWKEIFGNKEFLTLNMDKDEFFNDYVNYKIDHDKLHELVAYPNEPMYNKCLKDGCDVLIDKDKFEQLDHHDKIKMFREEITVIAIERWLMNDKCYISWFQAYIKSLRKTITNLTKNWACEFIIEHLDEFVKPRKSDFEHALKIINQLKESK